MTLTIKYSEQANYLSVNTIYSCLIKILHGRSLSRRACITIAKLAILTVPSKIKLDMYDNNNLILNEPFLL